MAANKDMGEDAKAYKKSGIILLMGNPNVGKSVLFSNLTGIRVISSNYAGTTVTYTEGTFKLGDETYTLIDVPGTYSLDATSEAEEVAVRFIDSKPLAVICVLDDTNLERNIKLGLDIQKYNIPVVYALNMLDVAKRRGYEINVGLLSKELGAPVVPTVAVKNEGIKELTDELKKVIKRSGISRGSCAYKRTGIGCDNCAAKRTGIGCGGCASCPGCFINYMNTWDRAREITAKVRKTSEGKVSFLDRLGNSMLKPWPGIPMAILVILFSMGIIVGTGKLLQGYLLGPLVNEIIVPFFRKLISSVVPAGLWRNVLIGEYGIFAIGFEWIIESIFPYVFLFYVVFSFLEDSGILPRLSVLFDSIMRKLGVQGGSMITILLGYGCAVPAIIGSRTATTKKERLLISCIVCFSVPCISQTGALISLFAGFSPMMLVLMFLLSFAEMMLVSTVLSRLIKGKVDPMIIEIPNLLIPNGKAYAKKLMLRMKNFLIDAEIPMLLSIVFAALFKETGLLDRVAVYLEPVVSGWLGLPKNAVIALILGIIRREMAVAPLLEIEGLTALQAFVGGTVALLYLPCLSVFGVLAKEFNTRTALAIALATTLNALLVGGLINQIVHLLMKLF